MRQFLIFYHVCAVIFMHYGAVSGTGVCCKNDWMDKAEKDCKDAKITPTGLTGDEIIEFYFDYACDTAIIKKICEFNRNVMGRRLRIYFLVGARQNINEAGDLVCEESCDEDRKYACAADGVPGPDQDDVKINGIRTMTCCAALDNISLVQCSKNNCNDVSCEKYSYEDGYNDCLDPENNYLEEDILKCIVRDCEPFKTVGGYPIYPIFRVRGPDDQYPFDKCTSFRLGQDFTGTYCQMLADPRVGCPNKPK